MGPGPQAYQGNPPAHSSTLSILTHCQRSCSGWPGTCVHPASAFRTSGSQACPTKAQHADYFLKETFCFQDSFCRFSAESSPSVPLLSQVSGTPGITVCQDLQTTFSFCPHPFSVSESGACHTRCHPSWVPLGSSALSGLQV